jgi:hypothetical protein
VVYSQELARLLGGCEQLGKLFFGHRVSVNHITKV